MEIRDGIIHQCEKNRVSTPTPLEQRLNAFATREKISGKGPLSVVLTLTRIVSEMSFPLKEEDFLTEGGGQVKGLGRSAVQNILEDHGINRVLAEEGGRTSRGSMGKMTAYVGFLNQLHEDDLVDTDKIENWWVERVRAYSASKPLRLKADPSKSLRSIVADLIEVAFARQAECPGTMVAGAVMQHLVGAKLSLAAPDVDLKHNGFSVADSPSGRPGDFFINDTAVHVTTAPSEALIRKCLVNLEHGLRPLIITTGQGVGGAAALAKSFEVEGRVDVLDIEQFIATNVFEWSQFDGTRRFQSLDSLIETYNNIVEECETDPSLRIQRV